jgi:hypothetical protein
MTCTRSGSLRQTYDYTFHKKPSFHPRRITLRRSSRDHFPFACDHAFFFFPDGLGYEFVPLTGDLN